MKCQGCGHDYPSTLTRCTHCRLLNPKRAQSSRLIEFPRKARATVEKESVSNPLPAWRQEVNERVRAAKARKNLTPDPAPVQETTQPVPEPDYNEPNRYERQFTPRTGPITTPQRSTRPYTATSQHRARPCCRGRRRTRAERTEDERHDRRSRAHARAPGYGECEPRIAAEDRAGKARSTG